jgi:hypothetical protein
MYAKIGSRANEKGGAGEGELVEIHGTWERLARTGRTVERQKAARWEWETYE